MCGLAGVFGSPQRHDELATLVDRMIAPITHRGPDDRGTWVDAEAGVALGFRRLAIIDLSANGHQPMRSPSGRFMMVFNGEIYNHDDIRRSLRQLGVEFRGTSDTEVALAAFERWGIVQSLQRFVGMFSIAVWDAYDRALSLARDRMGKKPMFIAERPGLITFASELKALHAVPGFDRSLDRDAAAEFLRFLYVPGPRSIFRGVRKLEPGHVLTIRDAAVGLPASRPFWSLDDAVGNGARRPFAGSDHEAVDELERVLRDAVGSRMCADVPLGAFLSGGIDSSTVVALMQAQSSRPVRTFSIAFDQAEHNEAHHAAAVAKHLGTDHTEIPLTGKDALDVVPRLATIYDEPFADASQIPTYLVCREARREVTVALSGDGGDEVFGGYNRYVHGERMIMGLGRVPRPARRLLAASIATVGTGGWDRAYRTLEPLMPARMHHRLPGQKLHRLGYLMQQQGAAAMYRALVSQWPHPERLVPGSRIVPDAVDRALRASAPRGLLSRMMLADQSSYLVEDQMTKVDRASMSVSLEVRVPLLDHRVVELAWRLPEHLKVRDGVGKWVLRQVLYRYVPHKLVDREKMGFSVPLGAWLRGPLREWAESLVSVERLSHEDLLHAPPIRAAWRRVLGGDDQSALGIWAVLMLQQWRARWA
jgi:asparagine synthase (glutamine-hydrolysing)